MSPFNRLRFCALGPGRRAARAALLGGAMAAANLTAALAQPSSPTPLWIWLRRWLGNPPVATGGPRGPQNPATVCLLHPWLGAGDPKAAPTPLAPLSVPRPVLASATALYRIELRHPEGHPQEYRLLGAVEAQPGEASLPSTLPWPGAWPSLKPGDRYTLTLQPITSPDRAEVTLQAGSREAFRQTQAQIQRLGTGAASWEQAIEALLPSSPPPSPSSRALATSLLFAPEAPPSPRLAAMRRALQGANCRPDGR